MLKNRIGLGTFPLANVFAPVDKNKAKDIVKTFLDNGGYFLDCAPMYGFGEVEVLLGEVFKEYSREKFYIATKCGYIDVEGKTFQTIQKSGKYDGVIRECERSLKRLQVDYIDLYFMHSPDPKVPIEETLRGLEKLQTAGKIKNIGVSNVNLKELKEYNKTGKIKFIQNRFSLINQSIDSEIQKYLMENNIKLVPYQVIDRGQLSNRSVTGLELGDKDLRKGRSDWLEGQTSLITFWVKENLLPLAKEFNISIEQLSMSWVLEQEFMGFIIVGATNPDQVKSNLHANEIKLTLDQLSQMDNAYIKLEKEIKDKYGKTIREFRGLNEKYY